MRKKCPYLKFSGLYFPAFGMNAEVCKSPYPVWTRESTVQKKSEYGYIYTVVSLNTGNRIPAEYPKRNYI